MTPLALVLLLVSVTAAPIAHDTARTAAEEFGTGRFSDLRSRFTPELNDSLGPVRLFFAQRAKARRVWSVRSHGRTQLLPG
jgi:hypothetical protein